MGVKTMTDRHYKSGKYLKNNEEYISIWQNIHKELRKENGGDPETIKTLNKLIIEGNRIENEALKQYIEDTAGDYETLEKDAKYMIRQIHKEDIEYVLHIAYNDLLREKIQGELESQGEEITEEKIRQIATEKRNNPEEIGEKELTERIQAEIRHLFLDEQYEAARYTFENQISLDGSTRKYPSRTMDEYVAFTCHISELAEEKINKIIKQAGGIYKLCFQFEPKHNYQDPVDAEALQLEFISKDLIAMPSSTTGHIIASILSNRGDIPAYIQKKNIANKNRALSIKDDADPIQIKQGDNEYKIVYVKGKETLSVSISEIDGQIKKSIPAYNIWTYILPLIEKQAYSHGELYAGYVTFTLQDLVDIGMYKDIRTARDGYKSAAEGLISLKAEAYDNKTGSFTLANIFTAFTKPANNVCTVHINPMIVWKNLFKYHDQLPAYHYSLPIKAKTLLNNLVAYLARQNADQIRDTGYFTISLRQVQAELGLPDEHKTKDVNGKIKAPIVEAINKINEADGDRFYKLVLEVDKAARPTDYLNTGKIRVYPLNEVKEHILNISDRQQKIIEDNTKKAEKKQVDAMAKAYKKKLDEGKDLKDILGGNT